MMEYHHSLCFRCEHRALYYESDGSHHPRCECGDAQSSSHSCYMFQPVKPLVLAVDKGDRRPQFAGWMISARNHAVRLADVKLKLKEYKDGNAIYWQPKRVNVKSKAKK